MPAENYFIIPVYGVAGEEAVNDAVRRGFRWLFELAKNDPTKQRALLGVQAKHSLSGYVGTVLGDEIASRLGRKKTITIQSGQEDDPEIELTLLTEQNQVPYWNCPILAVHPRPALLDRIEEWHGVRDVLVIPWIEDDVVEWIAQHEPTELPPDD